MVIIVDILWYNLVKPCRAYVCKILLYRLPCYPKSPKNGLFLCLFSAFLSWHQIHVLCHYSFASLYPCPACFRVVLLPGVVFTVSFFPNFRRHKVLYFEDQMSKNYYVKQINHKLIHHHI